MKAYSVTFQTLTDALKHQWKLFLAVVLSFAILGIAGGLLFAEQGSSETGGGGADPLPDVDFQTVAYTPSYYNDCLQELLTSYRLLDSYINTVFSIELPENPSKEWLLERQTELTAEQRIFQQTTLLPLQYTLEETGKIYVPAEFLDTLTSNYKSQLSTVQIDLLAAEAATETIRQMTSPVDIYVSESDSSNDESIFVAASNTPMPTSIVDSYTYLLDQAANYGRLLKTQATYEALLDQLQNERRQIQIKSSQVEQQLVEVAQDLNTLMAEVSQTAEEIGKTAYMHIRLDQNVGGYTISVDHSYRPASIEESFAVIELFCVLVGICAGAFLAVCREAKRHPIPAEEN